MVYFEELTRLGVPRSCNPQGLSIIAPSLLDHGTPEQIERYVLPTLHAEISWCLGMSEPDAGSDLAGLTDRAELVGDKFVVNGQKVWTSGAHDSDYCFCFVRTDPDAPKHAGISVLVIDMRTPGIETRPLAELTDRDHADFNEVFFTDVEVDVRTSSASCTTGGRSQADRSRTTRDALDQRGDRPRAIHRAGRGDRDHSPRRRQAPRRRSGAPRLGSPSAYVQSHAVKLLGYQGFSKIAKGRPAPEHSVLKLLGSETRRGLALEISEALGPCGVDLDRRDAPSVGRRDHESWALHHLQSFSGTIAGGTSEIQRNIIAERVLGLPRR